MFVSLHVVTLLCSLTQRLSVWWVYLFTQVYWTTEPFIWLMQGWWSYEVCCLSHINQFHAEKDQLQSAHSLGQSSCICIQLTATPAPTQHNVG